MGYSSEKGIWRTIGGRRVFISDGADLYTAMEQSGKFLSGSKNPLLLPRTEYIHVVSELNTYYSSFKGKKTVAKCIGDFVYIFENHGFDNYTIFQRECVDKHPMSWRYIHDEKK